MIRPDGQSVLAWRTGSFTSGPSTAIFTEMRLLLFAIIGALPLVALLPSATLQSRLALHEAHALLAQGQQEEAIAQYEKVLKVDPRQAYAWFSLARAHEPVERAPSGIRRRTK